MSPMMNAVEMTPPSPSFATVTTRAYTVLVRNIPAIEAQVVENTKRAKKLGLPGYTFTKVGEARQELRTFLVNKGERETLERIMWVQDIEIQGPARIQFDGWTFVGIIEHGREGNLVKGLEGADMSAYTFAKGSCDHCQHNRARAKTLIASNGDKTVQLGTACVKHYLRGSQNFNIAAMAEFVLNAEFPAIKDEYDGEFEGGSGSDYFTVRDAMAAGIMFMLREGYKSKSENPAQDTKERVMFYLRPGKSPEARARRDALVREGFSITDAHWAMADEIEAYFGGLTDAEVTWDSFLNNVRTIVRTGDVSARNISILVGAVWGRIKAQYVPADKPVSQHVGAVKERRTFTVKLERVFEFDGLYGVTRFYLFRDVEGNVIKWKTGTDLKIEVGTELSFVGTISAHVDYKGVAQTEVQRCKVVQPS